MINRLHNFCVNKVLPLVYDESLSYYEVLCKLTRKINEVIEIINGNISDIIKASVMKYLSELTFNAMYDNESKATIFYFEEGNNE